MVDADVDRFYEYVEKGLSGVDDASLCNAIRAGFDGARDLLGRYAEAYSLITSRKWPPESLCAFFCGWRGPDAAAHAVSSIIIRILRESGSCNDDRTSKLLLQAARHCGEVIIDDIGLGEMQGHAHHSELYYRMATAICESDRWRQRKNFFAPAMCEFPAWVARKRPLAADLAEAIEMMLMAEIFNTGEYNMMTPMWKTCLREHYGFSGLRLESMTSFLNVHCGDVEAAHFRHAAKALTLYAEATGGVVHYERIRRLSREYVGNACSHIMVMSRVLSDGDVPRT